MARISLLVSLFSFVFSLVMAAPLTSSSITQKNIISSALLRPKPITKCTIHPVPSSETFEFTVTAWFWPTSPSLTNLSLRAKFQECGLLLEPWQKAEILDNELPSNFKVTGALGTGDRYEDGKALGKCVERMVEKVTGMKGECEVEEERNEEL